MPKCFGLLKEVGHIAKWGVFTEITFFGSKFFRAVIRACTGSFENVYPGTSPLYIKVGQISGLSENGSWVLVDARRFFFYGSWIRACTGSFGDVPKYFGLLKEVGHIAKWGVFTEITFFGSNFFRAVIRACTGSFENVYPGTSPLYIKVGQISGLSENGSWVLVDARRFFFYGSWIRACTGSFGDVPKYFTLLKEVGYIAKWWVFTKITFLGSNFFRAVIRACTGSFANVYPGTSPLYIKVGQILGLSKMCHGP